MKRLMIWMLTLACCLAPLTFLGCEQQTPAEKRAEEIGDDIEDATDDAGDRLEDIGDEIEDATE